MVDINELDLSPEDLGGQVDYDAPEGGSFAPTLSVGFHEFVFKLEEINPFEGKQVQSGPNAGKKYLQVSIAPTPVVDGVEAERPLRFQNVNTSKSEKMRNSTLGELFRALGIRIEGALTPEVIASELQAAEGQGLRFKAFVDWRAYNKETGETFSTSPNPKRGDKAWPRSANGSGYDPQIAVEFSDGNSALGREQINPLRFKLANTD